MENAKKTYQVLESGVATVRMEPRGEHGMEGFALGDVVTFELVTPITREKAPLRIKRHYRVYPKHGGGWYDTCGPNIFSTYFREGDHS